MMMSGSEDTCFMAFLWLDKFIQFTTSIQLEVRFGRVWEDEISMIHVWS